MPQPHSPFAASLANPLHLWHLSLLWLRTDAVGTEPRTRDKGAARSSGSFHRHSVLSNLPSTIEEGSDPSVDAQAAIQTVYKHVKSLIAYECSSTGGVSKAAAPKKKSSFSPDTDDDTSDSNVSMRHQVLRPLTQCGYL